MTKYNRREHLKQLHTKRKMTTLKKVDNAIQKLIKTNGNINFNSVAVEAGISKATLYNNIDIRKRIESLRDQQGPVTSPKYAKREMDENNKDAIIASLKRKIKKMNDENKELRVQLKFAYAEVYKKI